MTAGERDIEVEKRDIRVANMYALRRDGRLFCLQLFGKRSHVFFQTE